jgi:carbamoyl-phosphate synthase large subunit
LGIDTTYRKALLKAFIAGGYKFGGRKQRALISLNDHYKNSALGLVKEIFNSGFFIMATWGTHKFLEQNGIPSKMIHEFMVDKLQKRMKEGRLGFILNTPRLGKNSQTSGYHIRTIAEMYRVPCFTCIDTAQAYIQAVRTYDAGTKLNCDTITSYRKRKFLGLF